MDNLRIAVDFDGTLAEQESALCEVLRDDYDIDIYPEDFRTWHQDIHGTDLRWGSALKKYWDDPDFIDRVEPHAGAVEAMQQLHDAGAELVIATHRKADDEAVTREWLDTHNIPYDEFQIGKGWNKANANADVLIDDHPKNITDVVEADQRGIILLTQFNFDMLDDLPESKRVHSALDATPHSSLTLALRPGIQWRAIPDILADIAADN